MKRPKEQGLDWCRRIGWLIAIWAASVAALGLVSLLLRLLMGAAYLTR